MSLAFDIHPELQGLIDAANFWPPQESLAGERAYWAEFCLSLNRPCPPGIAVEDRRFPCRDAAVPVRLYRPPGDGKLPCIVYLHDGGWVLGGLDTSDSIAWGLCEGTGAVVASVDYRLAPEHPYPAAFDDAYAVLQHLSAKAATLGIDGTRIALCGDSAGGNLATALCLAARDLDGPRPVAQALVYPVLGVDFETRSHRENAEAPLLSGEAVKSYLRAYLGRRLRRPPPYALPMLAEDLGGLPPALVHTAQFDPLRDEGENYAESLSLAGTPTLYRCAARMTHSFLRARFAGPAARAEFDFLCDFLKEKLGL